jgi:hypothetical protein
VEFTCLVSLSCDVSLRDLPCLDYRPLFPRLGLSLPSSFSPGEERLSAYTPEDTNQAALRYK